MALLRKDVPISFDRDLSRMRNRLQRFFEEPFGFELPLPMIGEKRSDRVLWSPAVEAKDRTWHLWERSYGEFQRTFRFPLPVNEGKVSAEFTDGLLKVTVPKMEATPPTARKVPIAKR